MDQKKQRSTFEELLNATSLSKVFNGRLLNITEKCMSKGHGHNIHKYTESAVFTSWLNLCRSLLLSTKDINVDDQGQDKTECDQKY